MSSGRNCKEERAIARVPVMFSDERRVFISLEKATMR